MADKKISKWILLIICIASIYSWYAFSYPQLAFVDFSIDRNDAIKIAARYLIKHGVPVNEYKHAAVFGRDNSADRYLQKTIGFDKFKSFIKEHDFDIFFWIIRFFKEGEKEEYRITVSTADGDITAYKHAIPAEEERPEIPDEESKAKVRNFLKDRFGFNEDLYKLTGDSKSTLENRKNYSLVWEKKSVHIPWSNKAKSGKGKLLTGATISGTEIISFSKNSFSVPEDFNRDLAKRKITGSNLSTIVRVLHIIIFVAAMYYLIVRRNHIAMHATKKFYIYIVFCAFVLTILSKLNYFQEIIFNYYTTSPFNSYLWRYAVNAIVGIFFAILSIIIPSLSGELLHYESFKEKKEGSFLYYIQSTFFSREVAALILYGYIFWIVMLGFQSALFEFGQKYLGVWVEYNWLGQMSSAYLPFLAALTIGFKASVSEELLYRMFAISWFKKIFKSTVLAVILSSLIWGFAHSGYPVFPMWFRGIEVTCLGLLLSFVYLRYGLITVLVTHYLFDVFWGVSGYILGTSKPFDFYSSIFIMIVPLLFAIIAYIKNSSPEEKKVKWNLNKSQKYNLEILKDHFRAHPEVLENKSYEKLREEIVNNGWDLAVIEMALEEFNKKSE